MRQIHYSFFILSQTFLTLFFLKNIFMWYEWLEMHVALQPCFLQWNKFFLPPAPNCLSLQYSYPFFKLPHLSLTDSTKMAGWHKVHWTGLHALHLLACHHRLMFLTMVAAARRRVCLCSCVRPGEEEQAAGCDTGIWLQLPQGPQSCCSAGWFFCTHSLFQNMKAPLPAAIQCEPVPLLSLHLLGDEYKMAKLCCFPLSQSNGEHSSPHYLPAPC